VPLGIERIGWRTRNYIFRFAALLSSLYLFSLTNDLVKPIVDYQLEEIPFLSVKNILGGLLFVLFVALVYNQVD